MVLTNGVVPRKGVVDLGGSEESKQDRVNLDELCGQGSEGSRCTPIGQAQHPALPQGFEFEIDLLRVGN